MLYNALIQPCFDSACISKLHLIMEIIMEAADQMEQMHYVLPNN